MMRKAYSLLFIPAIFLLMQSCAKRESISKSRYSYSSSKSATACKSFRYVEKSDNYSRFRNEIKDIVCLDPGYYFFNTRTASFQYNDYSQKKIEQVRQASMKAFAKRNIKGRFLYPNSGDSLADLIAVMRLRAEIKSILFNFQSENANQGKECGKSTVKMIGTDINISPEYASLVNVLHSNYVYYTYAEERSGSITLVSGLADIALGKIVYMECKKIHKSARHIRNILSNSVYTMLSK